MSDAPARKKLALRNIPQRPHSSIMSEGLDLFSSDEAPTTQLARRHWLILPPPDEAERCLPLISLPPLATPEREVLALSFPYPPA
jgi:hypothetical protein